MKISIFSILTFFCAAILIGISGSEALGQTNLALNKKATQSSVNEWKEANLKGTPEHAVDGDTNGGGIGKIAETDYKLQNDSWFEVDLGDFYKINKIVIHPRTDCCQNMFKSAYLIVTDQAIGAAPVADEAKINSSSTFSKFYDPIYEPGNKARTIAVNGSVGRFVRVQIIGGGAIQLAEVEVFGEPTPVAGYTPNPGKAWTSTAVAGSDGNSSAPNSSASDPRNLARKSGVTAKQSSVNVYKLDTGKEVPAGPAEKAIDGDTKGNFWEGGIVETKDGNDAWFEVDLKNYYKIEKIRIHPRADCCRQNLFNSTFVIVTDQPIEAKPLLNDARIYNSSTFTTYIDPLYVKTDKVDTTIKEIDTKGSVGRFVRLQMKGWGSIELSEIEIIGDPMPIAAYKPDAGKAWDAVFKNPFDPSRPYFPNVDRATNDGYWGTLQGSPKIVVAKNSPTSFDVAYQDLYGDGKKIRINSYDKTGTGFKKNAAASTEMEGLGTFAGFAKDTGKNRYVFTGEPWTNGEQIVKAQVTKIPVQGSPQVIWNAKYFEYNDPPKTSLTDGVRSLMGGFTEGTSRLVTAGNSLLITTNIFPAHPYQVILDTQDKSKNANRAFFESLNQHNFGQRAIFDGKDFVIMENRDHDVTVSMTKLSPEKPLPLIDETKTAAQVAEMTDLQKWNGHPGPFTKKLYSVYSHTNFGNNTYTELGNVEKGFSDNGYLVLFSGERDWNYKMTGYNFNPDKRAPNILSPRDIGLVHVKKDFENEKANWVDKDGNLTMCPMKVDNSSIVNSTGVKTTVNYRADEDGWDWAKTYNEKGPCKNTLGKDRVLETKGVKWVTTYGASYATSMTKADEKKEFTSVNHPKLVRIAQNNYIAVWEEWTAKRGEPQSKYITTKAVLITLKAAANGEVNIESTSVPKDLGNIRLMPGDDAFEFDGKPPGQSAM